MGGIVKGIKKAVKGVVKGSVKAVKGVTGFVKDNWKPIAAAGAILFTGGLATIGISGFTGAVGSMGFWPAVGSTMWAGVTATAGTFGLGAGASGTAASLAGYQGATLGTGAAAQAMGLARPLPGTGPSANVGQYTGPFSRAGATSGAGTQAARQLANQPASEMTRGEIEDIVRQNSGGGRSGLMRDLGVAALPALITTGGAYMMAKAEEEAARPAGLWGADMDTGQTYDIAQPGQPNWGQPGGLMSYQGYQQYAQNPYGQFGGQFG